MMASGLGQLAEFCPGHDRLSIYLERFEMYVVANGILVNEKELQHLASNCDFGQFLEEALCDCLVFGIRSESTRKQLLAQTNIKLAKVVELALSMEAVH